jgi:transcriptional regulator with XRE-family HTH domain
VSDQRPDGALAKVLRRLREERGESREALAYRAGLTAGTLAEIERARSVPSWVSVRAIAQALGVSMAELGAAVEQEQ